MGMLSKVPSCFRRARKFPFTKSSHVWETVKLLERVSKKARLNQRIFKKEEGSGGGTDGRPNHDMASELLRLRDQD